MTLVLYFLIFYTFLKFSFSKFLISLLKINLICLLESIYKKKNVINKDMDI
jgi:hypothetical protein